MTYKILFIFILFFSLIAIYPICLWNNYDFFENRATLHFYKMFLLFYSAILFMVYVNTFFFYFFIGVFLILKKINEEDDIN